MMIAAGVGATAVAVFVAEVDQLDPASLAPVPCEVQVDGTDVTLEGTDQWRSSIGGDGPVTGTCPWVTTADAGPATVDHVVIDGIWHPLPAAGGTTTGFPVRHDPATGRFLGKGESGGSASPGNVQRRVLGRPDGFTLDPVSGRDITTGFAVAIDNKLSDVVPVDEFKGDKQRLRGYLGRVREYAKAHAGDSVALGGWRDDENGVFVLDHVQVLPNTAEGRKEALRLGVERDQRSIFHLDTLTEIPTGGTGGYTDAGTDNREPFGLALLRGHLRGHDRRGARRPDGRDSRQLVPTGDRNDGVAAAVERHPAFGLLAFPVRHDPASGKFLPTGAAGGAPGTADSPHVDLVTSDVDEAAKAILAGKTVQLDQPRTLSTLIDKLAAIGKDAVAKGEKAPVYDLCKVTVAHTNLFCSGNKGIDRVNMPQLTSAHPIPGSIADKLPRNSRGEVDAAGMFRQHLIDKGVKITDEQEDPAFLRATQDELNGVQVATIARKVRDEGMKLEGAIWVSKDNYILDGHHRWAAQVALEAEEQGRVTPINVHRVDMSITELLTETNDFVDSVGLPRAAVGDQQKVTASIDDCGCGGTVVDLLPFNPESAIVAFPDGDPFMADLLELMAKPIGGGSVLAFPVAHDPASGKFLPTGSAGGAPGSARAPSTDQPAPPAGGAGGVQLPDTLGGGFGNDEAKQAFVKDAQTAAAKLNAVFPQSECVVGGVQRPSMPIEHLNATLDEAVAMTTPDGKTWFSSEAFASTRARSEAEAAYANPPGETFHAPGTDNLLGAVTHEFGHAAQYDVLRRAHPELASAPISAFNKAAKEQANAAVAEARKATPDWPAHFASYATADSREAVAEAISHVALGGHDPGAVALVKYLGGVIPAPQGQLTQQAAFPVRHSPASGRWLPASGVEAAGPSRAKERAEKKADTAKPGGAHGVGVTDPNDSTSLVNKAGGRRPGEELAAYNDRVFKEGQERYEPVAALEGEAGEIRDELGLPDPEVGDWNNIEAPFERLTETADAFYFADSNPSDTEVRAAYKDLVAQTMVQWQHLTAPESEGGQGIKVDFVTQKEIIGLGLDPKGLNPYRTAADQAADLRDNHHLYTASISDWPEAHHPILDSSKGGEYDKFRAVHDSYGHAAIGADFTRHGEYQAWLHHSSMFTGPARLAASTELTGENSFLCLTGRPATHKATLLPPKLIAMPWDEAGHYQPSFWEAAQRSGLRFATTDAQPDPTPLSQLLGYEVPDKATATGDDLALLDVFYDLYGAVNSHDALHGAIYAQRLEAGQAPPTADQPDDALTAGGAISGAMVAAVPSVETAPAITGEVGLAHVTLCYLGDDAGAIPDDARAAIDEFVSTVASEEEPFCATVAGYGTMGPQGAVVLLLNSDALAAAHDELQAGLEAAGLCPPWSHDGFIPHLTLSYGGDLNDPELKKLIGTELDFDALVTVYGGDEREHPLGQQLEPTDDADVPDPSFA